MVRARVARTPRVAQWAVQAIDLTANPGEAAKYLTVGQLSDAVGLAESTILDSITRAPITVAANPRSAICRPAAHIGFKVPLWNPKQRDEYLRIREESNDAKDVVRKLEGVNEEEARKRGLHSLVEFSGMFDLHDQTLRRAASQDKTFPHAVAQREVDTAGVPEHLFPIEQMFNWARSKGYTTDTPVSA